MEKRFVRQKDNKLAIRNPQPGQHHLWSLGLVCFQNFSVSIETLCRMLRVSLYRDRQRYPNFRENWKL